MRQRRGGKGEASDAYTIEESSQAVKPGQQLKIQGRGYLSDTGSIIATTLGWIVFAVYEVGIWLNKRYSAHPLCPHSDASFPFYYWAMN